MSTTTQTFRIARGSFAAVLGAAASILVTACSGDSIMAPASNSRSSAGAGEVIGSTTVTETAIVGTETNDCNAGELVPYHGKVSYAAFVTGSDNFHQRTKFSYVFDGTGSLGNVYHGASEYSEEWNVQTPPAEYNFDHNVTMTSPTAPDFKLHMVLHIHVSLTGTTVTVDQGPRMDCHY